MLSLFSLIVSFCLFLGVLAKRSGFALAFLFTDLILEWVVLGIITWKGNYELAQKVQDFLPLTSMSNLIKQPFQRIRLKNLIGGIILIEFNFPPIRFRRQN